MPDSFRVVLVITAETALIACNEIFVFGHTAGKPTMAARSFEIPNFVFVDETHAITFG